MAVSFRYVKEEDVDRLFALEEFEHVRPYLGERKFCEMVGGVTVRLASSLSKLSLAPLSRLLIEHRRDEAQARRVLAAVRQHFPDSPAAAEAARLGELLDRLGAVAAP